MAAPATYPRPLFWRRNSETKMPVHWCPGLNRSINTPTNLRALEGADRSAANWAQQSAQRRPSSTPASHPPTARPTSTPTRRPDGQP